MLMREQITERARHHKLNSTDKAVAHLNQLENRELSKMMQEMQRTQRKMVHYMDQNRKQFKRMRRQSMGRVLLLNNGEAKFARCPRSNKVAVLKNINLIDSKESLDDLVGNELMTIVETHEKRRASFCPQADNFFNQMKSKNIKNIFQDFRLPPIILNDSSSVKSHGITSIVKTGLTVPSSVNHLKTLPDINITREHQEENAVISISKDAKNSPGEKKEVSLHIPEPSPIVMLMSHDNR